MPLLDHFHPPLSVKRRWESLHATWTVCLADALTPLLPEGYFVEVQTHAGSGVEIDVAAFDEGGRPSGQGNGVVATAPLGPPHWAVPAVFPASFEVRVISTASGPTLVAAVELISPGNKDRPESRRAFACKCASYLYQGVSVLMVDVVTERAANLHNETMRVMEAETRFHMPADANLYAVAYRPLRHDAAEEIHVWPRDLRVGEPLPELPLVSIRKGQLPSRSRQLTSRRASGASFSDRAIGGKSAGSRQGIAPFTGLSAQRLRPAVHGG